MLGVALLGGWLGLWGGGLAWGAGIATGSYGEPAEAATPPPAPRPPDDAARTGRQLEALRQRMRDLERRKQEHKAQRDVLHQGLQQAEETVAELGAALHRTRGQRAEQLARLEQLRPRLAAGRAALEQRKAALGALMRTAYLTGRRTELELLLDQRDPMMASRLMLYYDYLNRSRSREIRQIRATVAELDALTRRLEREEAELQRAERELAADKARMETAQAARSDLVDQLERKVQDEGLRLEEMQADNRRLDGLFERLLKESSQRFAADEDRVQADSGEVEAAVGEASGAQPDEVRNADGASGPDADAQVNLGGSSQPERPFAALAGELPWPVSGELEAQFETRKASGLTWDGVVIGAEEGAEVRAVYPGTVVFADWLRGFGLLLILDHGGGYMTLYGQNQSLFKARGDHVGAGEVVGLAGRSGGQDEPGVYFGVRYRGRPQDPKHWCVAAHHPRKSG